VTLSQALESPLVLPDRRDGLRNSVERAAQDAGIGMPRLTAEVNSLSVIKHAVLQGVGATILPPGCIEYEIRHGALRACEIVDPPLHCTVALFTRRDALLDRAAASIFRLAIATATELCATGRWTDGAIVDDDGARALPADGGKLMKLQLDNRGRWKP
jgi:LysR family transcriptional regulator, nitrogen assimilation regulatory protein